MNCSLWSVTISTVAEMSIRLGRFRSLGFSNISWTELWIFKYMVISSLLGDNGSTEIDLISNLFASLPKKSTRRR